MKDKLVSQQIKAILSSQTCQEVINHLLVLGGEYTLSGVIYSSIYYTTPLVAGEENIHRWVEHLMANNFSDLGSLYRSANQSGLVQCWRANQSNATPSSKKNNLYQEIANFDITQGFDLFVHDADSGALLSFYFASASIDIEQAILQSVFKLLSIYAHERIKQLSQHQQLERKVIAKNIKLTARELDCLRYIKNGYTYDDISKHLRISVRTVTFHLQNAKEKLQAQTLPHAIAIVILNNII